MRRFSTCSITEVVVRYIVVVLIQAGDTLLLCGWTNLLLQQVSTFKTNDNKTTKTSKSQSTSILAVVFHFLVLGIFLAGLVSIPAVWFIPGPYQVALSTHDIIQLVVQTEGLEGLCAKEKQNPLEFLHTNRFQKCSEAELVLFELGLHMGEERVGQILSFFFFKAVHRQMGLEGTFKAEPSPLFFRLLS